MRGTFSPWNAAIQAHFICQSADHDWRLGKLLTEEPLISHVTKRILESALLCPTNFRINPHILHRQGVDANGKKDKSDLWGSDLAVSIQSPNFNKVAFFQFKRSKQGKAVLERLQLGAAKSAPMPIELFWVLAAETSQFDFRIENVDRLVFPTGKTKTFHTINWYPDFWWFLKWFSCHIGTSNMEVPRIVARLSEYIVQGEQVYIQRELPRWVPNTWLQIESDNDLFLDRRFD